MVVKILKKKDDFDVLDFQQNSGHIYFKCHISKEKRQSYKIRTPCCGSPYESDGILIFLLRVWSTNPEFKKKLLDHKTRKQGLNFSNVHMCLNKVNK